MKPFETRARRGSGDDRDSARWESIQQRNPHDRSRFFFGVTATGVYCRPGCPARTPHRHNVRFFETREQAESAGFRPCKRCQPERTAGRDNDTETVATVCRWIERSEETPKLADLAHRAGLSPRHLHRLFQRVAGVTPGAYAREVRLRRVRRSLRTGGTVTAALYDAGYGASSRFYEGSGGMLGMSPSEYRAGGEGSEIRHSIVSCSLGFMLVAATPGGICAVRFGDDAKLLETELRGDYPHARFVQSDDAFDAWVKAIVELTEHGSPPNPHLPVDIRGTAFQRRVWEELQRIRRGETANYAEIAARIGAAKASRAVGLACASNPLAVLIPCHRVVRKDGSLGGYRWGIERKKKLLLREGAG